MAQAWHRQREELELVQSAGAQFWRASQYEVKNLAGRRVVEAAPNATWQRFTPFDSYKPTSKVRDVEAGPHLTFLRLKSLWEKADFGEDESDLFHKGLRLFAKKYGLLGAFEEDYLERYVFPMGKGLVAPEAMIDDQGRLQRFDPSTTGKELLWSTLQQGGLWRPSTLEAVSSSMALPSEIKFIPKNPRLDTECWPVEFPRTLVPWEAIKEDFGAILVLKPDSFEGVSVLCTREPLRRWELHLRFFPSGDTPVEELVGEYYNSLNAYLKDVSPCGIRGEDGNLRRGWYCRSLLQAMHVQLFLDLTGDNTVKKCQSQGCPNHFRIGSQSKSIYCSGRCASRASTRRGRGQEP